MVDRPLVSIGVPVYNEERFLAETLATLVTQDYPNVEIIISDNASTDGTAQIGREFASIQKQVSFHRFDQNQGASANFLEVLRLAQGKYFMWASGHDTWSANYVSACVSLLERSEANIIAFGSCRWIDENGNFKQRESGWTDTRGMLPAARLFTVLWGNMHPMLGLMRVSVVRETGVPPYVGGDLILLSDLSLRGHFVHATEASWCRREFRPPENYSKRMERYQQTVLPVQKPFLDRYFPVFRIPIMLMRVVVKSKLSMTDKLLVLGALIPSMLTKFLVMRRAQR